MWRKKRFIIGLLVAVVVVLASLGGVALAQDETDNSQHDTLLGKVADILGIDQQRVEDAFSKAQTELREEALDARLQALVDKGVITEDQAAEYKTWLESRPDMSEYQDQLENWLESKPDIGIGRGFGAFGGLRSFGGLRGRCGMGGFDELSLRSE
jgi:hypothetical protein